MLCQSTTEEMNYIINHHYQHLYIYKLVLKSFQSDFGNKELKEDIPNLPPE